MLDWAYLDDFQIHGIGAFCQLTKVGGLGSPMPRNFRQVRTQQHGAIDLTRYYDARVIPLDGYIQGGTQLEAWDNLDLLKSTLQLGAPHVFRFRRNGRPEDDEFANVVVSTEVETPVDVPALILPWGVTVVASDPRIYSSTIKSGTYDPTDSTSGGGTDMPLVFPLVFSTTTTSHLELVNTGQFPSPPILTVHGPVENPAIDNDTLGVSIYIIYNLGDSDEVQIDVLNRLVTLNGAPRPDLYDAANSTWWEIVKGINSLRLRGTGMLPDVTSLSAQFRDARI